MEEAVSGGVGRSLAEGQAAFPPLPRRPVIVRRATVAPAPANAVTIGEATVTGTTDVVLAAMLAAPEAPPDVRAMVACHYLLPEAPPRPGAR